MSIEASTLIATTIAAADPTLGGSTWGVQGTTLKRFPGPYPAPTTYAAAIPMSGFLDMGEITQSTDIALTYNSTGAANYAETLLDVKADGSHNLTVTGFTLVGTQTFANTSGRVNMFSFWRRGGRNYYSVVLGPIV